MVSLPTDEGRKSVVMGKADYTAREKQLLKGGTHYYPRDTDSHAKPKIRFNETTTKLEDMKWTDEEKRWRMKADDVSNYAQFLGLLESSMKGVPLKQVVFRPVHSANKLRR